MICSAGQRTNSSVTVETQTVCQTESSVSFDSLSVEEPLEVRLTFDRDGKLETTQLAVTMRTPGDDRELAVGFLFTEGIIEQWSDVVSVTTEKCNIATIVLANHVKLDSANIDRHSFIASSCGVCGKKSIDAVKVSIKQQLNDGPSVSAEVIHGLPNRLRAYQSQFESTGGIHAAGLFDVQGNVIAIKEDVGRHNALDKLIGDQLISGTVPLTDTILMLSGRASFELVQKAARAGIAIVAAVGAPSSLAVSLAFECNITLLGFVRDNRFNIYTSAGRIKLS